MFVRGSCVVRHLYDPIEELFCRGCECLGRSFIGFRDSPKERVPVKTTGGPSSDSAVAREPSVLHARPVIPAVSVRPVAWANSFSTDGAGVYRLRHNNLFISRNLCCVRRSGLNRCPADTNHSPTPR